MGQKINPKGFRIGVNKMWDSVWYMPKEQYGDCVNQDLKIRELLRKELRTAGVARIEIKRFMSKIEVDIEVARPGVVIGRGGTQIEEIKEKINKIIKGKIILKVLEVKDPDLSAQLIADKVVTQLERRVVPKFAMSSELEKAVATGKVIGIRIWVSGRIKGAEIARTEKTQWGVIPLQTLKAPIDYAFSEAFVPNAGKHGVKVWVLKKLEQESKK